MIHSSIRNEMFKQINKYIDIYIYGKCLTESIYNLHLNKVLNFKFVFK
jgi:hypothetical protein